jgi:YVTN family beta-propeller protein
MAQRQASRHAAWPFISIALLILASAFVPHASAQAVVVATVNVGFGHNPQGLAYDSGTGEVFVANAGSGTVSVISDATNAVVATVGVGSYPEGVAYDSGKGEVFVTNFDSSGTASVISDATNAVVATVSVGGEPQGIAYDSGGGEVFVADFASSGYVSVVSDGTAFYPTVATPIVG